jgi:hypothetical protein
MTAILGGWDVNVVESHGVVADDAKARGGVHYLGINEVGEQGKQPVAVAHGTDDFVPGRGDFLLPYFELCNGANEAQSLLGDDPCRKYARAVQLLVHLGGCRRVWFARREANPCPVGGDGGRPWGAASTGGRG